MFRLLIPAMLVLGLLATPTVRAKFPDAKAPATTPVEQIIAALHDGKMDYEKDVRTTPFAELMSDVSKKFNIRFIVNKRAIGDMAAQLDEAKAERLLATDLESMTLGSFLNIYLPSLPVEGLTYLVRADHIEITSKEAAAKEVGLQQELAEATNSGDASDVVRATARFNLPIISIAAKGQQIASVFDDLRRVYGLNIVASAAVKNQLKTAVTVQLLNVPADTALELIAEQADLGVVRKGNTFRIISNSGA